MRHMHLHAYLAREWDIISQAPGIIATLILVSIYITWEITASYYAARYQERIRQLETEAAQYKSLAEAKGELRPDASE